MVNIFIANLDWSITSEDLKTTFSSFGTVHYAHVVYEKETKRSKGFGYVEMENAESAISAIEALNGMEINGRAIDVKIASPKSNRPPKKEKAPPKKKGGFNPNKPKFSKSPNNYSKPGGNSQQGGGGYRVSTASDGTEVRRKLRPRRNRNEEKE